MRYVIVILFFLFSNYSIAQRKNPITIILNTESGKISEEDKKKVPFDERFEITGEFKEKKVTSIQLKYRILGYCKNRPLKIRKNEDLSRCKEDCVSCKEAVDSIYQIEVENKTCNEYLKPKHYYLYGRLQDDGYVHLEKQKVDDNQFNIVMDPMHPNEYYQLHFTFFEKVIVDDKIQERIKKEVIASINTAFNFKLVKISQTDFGPLNQRIWSQIASGVENKELFNADGSLANKNLSSNKVLKKIYKDNMDAQNAIRNFLDNKVRFVDKDLTDRNKVLLEVKNVMESVSAMKGDLVQAYDDLLTNNHFKAKLKEPVNQLIDDKLKFQNIITFLRQDIDRWDSISDFSRPESNSNSYFLEVLMGRAKIGVVPFEKSDFFDLESGKLLWSFFTTLKYLNDSNSERIISNDNLDKLIEYLEKWINLVEEIVPEYDKLNTSIDEIPSLYSDYFIQNEVFANISTLEVLESKDSRYIGIDFGLMYAPDIQSTFVYEGVNFHFRPVNRRAKFRDLKGWDRFLKKFSFFLGIAQRVGNYDDNYEKLIGVGSPFIGSGYRLGRGFRINTGALFYEETNNNPIISNSNTNMTYFFSISWDAKLRDVIELITGELN